ncbi:MAG TPA: glycosyltransferase family 4 protein [Anaerolineae bacterium]|nr:glycosyltransferase family 4 protein [Anaerolineae bacterium]
MRVLLINKFLRPVGGTETVFFDQWRWLEAAGHHVIPFGLQHPDNQPHPYQAYELPAPDYNRYSLKQAIDLIWSRSAARRLNQLIRATQPDVAHLHNIYHQLSPSILATLEQHAIPAIMTVHDYKLICPNYRLYTQNEICQRCLHGSPWSAWRHRCLKDSQVASALVALETTLHRLGRVYHTIKQFITPSHFLRQKLISGGYPTDQIITIPHAIPSPPPPQPPPITTPYIFFAGRLEPEKGIALILRLATQLPQLQFILAGTGQLQAHIHAQNLPNIRLLGHLPPHQLAAWRQHARLVLVPSHWYETFGLTALEAMADARPVLASNHGALPELINHQETGFLLPPTNIDPWQQTIQQLWHNPSLTTKIGQQAREWVNCHFTPAQHQQAIWTQLTAVLS